MKQVAKFLETIKPSATLALAAKAKELKAKGVDVISLTVGEPDFDTPDNIKKAASDAIISGKTKYTPVDGILELRKAIQSRYSSRVKLGLENIIVSAGAKQSLYNCFMATVEPQAEVIIPAPYWVSYPDMIRLAKGVPVVVAADAQDSFKITASKLEEYITEKTRWIILNSPNNPTGMRYSARELEGVAALLKKYPRLGIVADDIYEDIHFADKPLSIIDVAPDLKDRIMVVNGVSKSYAMTGWRIGYCLGNEEVIRAMKIIQSQSTSNPCSISQYAALEALTGDQTFVAEARKVFKLRRDLAIRELGGIPEMSCVEPSGAFYVFLSCKQFFNKKTPDRTIINNDSDFCQYLLNEAKVVVVPGSAFGLNGHFRLSYAVSDDTIIKAVKRIKDACSKLV